MQELDIPIFKKAYDLCKMLYELRNSIPKQDRYALWQRLETQMLTTLEDIVIASQLPKSEKLDPLQRASVKLNVLRVLIRLAKDTKIIDLKKYTLFQHTMDEVGRMLGGWIKSVKE